MGDCGLQITAGHTRHSSAAYMWMMEDTELLPCILMRCTSKHFMPENEYMDVNMFTPCACACGG
jgi:hypothetical protein